MILCSAMGADDSLPDDVTTLQAMLRGEGPVGCGGGSPGGDTTSRSRSSSTSSSDSPERGALLDQLELQVADLEEKVAQGEIEAQAAAEKIAMPSFDRRKTARRPLSEHLARERIVYPVPAICPCCGDSRLRKIGEEVTETLSSFRASVR